MVWNMSGARKYDTLSPACIRANREPGKQAAIFQLQYIQYSFWFTACKQYLCIKLNWRTNFCWFHDYACLKYPWNAFTIFTWHSELIKYVLNVNCHLNAIIMAKEMLHLHINVHVPTNLAGKALCPELQ